MSDEMKVFSKVWKSGYFEGDRSIRSPRPRSAPAANLSCLHMDLAPAHQALRERRHDGAGNRPGRGAWTNASSRRGAGRSTRSTPRRQSTPCFWDYVGRRDSSRVHRRRGFFAARGAGRDDRLFLFVRHVLPHSASALPRIHLQPRPQDEARRPRIPDDRGLRQVQPLRRRAGPFQRRPHLSRRRGSRSAARRAGCRNRRRRTPRAGRAPGAILASKSLACGLEEAASTSSNTTWN